MKRCRLRSRRRKGPSRDRSRRRPRLEPTIRNKRRSGARRPCPVVAKRPAGWVFEPMKGSTMNALTRTAKHRPRSRKVYAGCRGPDGCVVWVIGGNSQRKPLNPRRTLRNHSPTGFEWGYGGSGPAQLALAILAEHLGDDHAALRLYQAFKWSCISQIRDANWSLSSEEIDNCLARCRNSNRAINPSLILSHSNPDTGDPGRPRQRSNTASGESQSASSRKVRLLVATRERGRPRRGTVPRADHDPRGQ